jgi:hypothetical protein
MTGGGVEAMTGGVEEAMTGGVAEAIQNHAGGVLVAILADLQSQKQVTRNLTMT